MMTNELFNFISLTIYLEWSIGRSLLIHTHAQKEEKCFDFMRIVDIKWNECRRRRRRRHGCRLP